ncbi:MAG: twin-arginine translocase TatA/TatE family subunit [Haloarculaceae archaeon]
MPGGPELLVILLIAVLLFGANKIPKLARSTGEAMGEFQKGREEVEQELEEIRRKKETNRTDEEQARLEAEDERDDGTTDEAVGTGVEAEREN